MRQRLSTSVSRQPNFSRMVRVPGSSGVTVQDETTTSPSIQALVQEVRRLTQAYIASRFNPILRGRLQAIVNIAKEQVTESFAIQPGAMTPATNMQRSSLAAAIRAADAALLQAQAAAQRPGVTLPLPEVEQPVEETPWYKKTMTYVIGGGVLVGLFLITR